MATNLFLKEDDLLTHLVEGPHILEKWLDTLHLPADNPFSVSLRYERGIQHIQQGGIPVPVRQRAYLDFLRGYLWQQLALSQLEALSLLSHLQEALDYYQLYVSSTTTISTLAYYAQWQMGLIQERLELPWHTVELTLMNATQHCKDRGEAVMHVIKHHRSKGDYGFAYMFSTMAKTLFQGKEPAVVAWGVDLPLYRWKFLNYHMSICNKLGMLEEASQSNEALWNYYQLHPDAFSSEQADQFFKNRAIFSHE